ncbi:ParB-like partition protein [Microbacterium phage Hendrix]|uniref:ParB-like nuclease domain protein n=1 Tax=Microbacterium phage Hendrix TaxID=2182341 RepID=A0A2U8UU44_9CAUD|nr:ParB-like partition protein [Microbacterium phage Hendrix]AWN07674.1 ParB-like nuclease domain protein [Microbacterium phage Hendrix]
MSAAEIAPEEQITVEMNTDFQVVPIDTVHPYENNPRRIPQDAINAVARSIELYGWQQPIVVDSENVIVVGHTRRLAALQLGYTEVPILVTRMPEEKIKQYRLVDNRTSEYSGWDHNALVMELREFEDGLLMEFFPDINLEADMVQSVSAPSEAELKWAQEKVTTVKDESVASLHTTGVTCPSCEAHFSVRTRSLPGMNEKLIEEIAGGEA